MADSPWNAKKTGRRADKPLKPQAARVERIPLTPPSGAGLVPEAVISPDGTGQNAVQPARVKRAGRKNKTPSPKPLVLLFAALALALAVTTFLHSRETSRLNTLVMQKEEEARKVQAHKDEHLNARARSGYMELIEKYAAEYGISPSFLSAVIKCESSFNPAAVSRVNARGLMQVMPDTGEWLANRLMVEGYSPERLYEADLNIRFGAYYLSYLSDMFSGSPVMTAAAFHAGDGNVKRWALNSAQDLRTITLEQIPTDDTRSYVRKVLDAYAIYYEEDLRTGQSGVPGAVPAPAYRVSAGSGE